MVVLYQIYAADGYAVLKPSANDSADYLARMNDGMSFWQAGRGVPLRSRWNDDWEFVIDRSFRHPKGIGDLAEMNRLITARDEGYTILKPLVGDAAEVLQGTYKGSRLWLFNITRQVAKEQIGDLGDGAIFRVNPAGLSIVCGQAFKDAVEKHGLTGLSFEKVGPSTLLV
jgi:hypothetical protein